MDSREFAEWMAYYAISPFGDDRADMRNGIVAATVANAAPFRKGGKTFEATDFMPFANHTRRRMSEEEIQMRVKMIWAASDQMHGKG